MNMSRLIVGVLSIFFGFWMFGFVGFVNGSGVNYWGILVGFFFLIFGFFILLNKREDEIEGRKDLNKKKSKK